jgi:hypothetical protein
LKTASLRRAAFAATITASVAASISLTGCVTNGQGQLVMDPNVSASIAAVMVPPPPPPVVAEVYEPMPYDANIAVVADRDVVFVGGNTYIWVRGPDGVRHRQLYAHGDHRADVFHRRDELHNVMARHDGHLPDHALGPQHMAGPAHGPMPAGGAHGPGVGQTAVAARGPNMAPARPAPQPKPQEKDKKKS